VLFRTKIAIVAATIVGALNSSAAAKCLTEVLKPVSTLSARVIGPDGLPIAGAKVAVLTSDGQVFYETRTRKDGRFTLKNIKPNGQMVKIKAIGFLDYTYRLGISSNSIKLHTMHLSPNSECQDIRVVESK
jgi:hypothetical protein